MQAGGQRGGQIWVEKVVRGPNEGGGRGRRFQENRFHKSTSIPGVFGVWSLKFRAQSLGSRV